QLDAGPGTGVICDARALPGTVLPAPARIYSARHWKCAADGLDSRFCGNDPCLRRDTIPNDISAQAPLTSRLGGRTRFRPIPPVDSRAVALGMGLDRPLDIVGIALFETFGFEGFVRK